MAITLADAVVFLATNSQGLTKGLKDAEGETTSWVGRVGGGITKGLGGAFVGASTLAIGAVVGVGAAAFDMASEVDAAMNLMIQRTDASAEQAAALEAALVDAFEKGVGESVAEAGETITEVFNAAGFAARSLSQDELSTVAQQAQAIKDVFGVDVAESVRVATQMVNTGLAPSFEDAFDTIVSGFQSGANAQGDLLDTLNEYSDDFADLGLTGSEVLGLLNSGLEAGALNTDKIADAINEFGVNLRDPAIRDSIAEIDDGMVDIFDAFQSGEITERDALEGMISRLGNVDDAIARDQLGVLLFRSMWEDMGESAVLALGDMQDFAEGTGGAVDSLIDRSRPIGERFELAGRQIQTALIPVGEQILAVAEEVLPVLTSVITDVVAPTIGNFAEAVLPTLIGVIRDVLVPVLMFFAETVLPAVTSFISDVLAPTITNLASTILPALSAFINDVLAPAWTAFVENVLPKIVTFINDVIAPAIAGFVNNVLPTVIEFFETRIFPLIDKIIQFIQVAWTVIGPIVEQIISGIVSNVEGLVTFFQETIVPVFDSIFAAIGNLLDAFIALFQGNFTEFGFFIGEAIQNVLNGLGKLAGDFMAAVGDLIGQIWEAFINVDWLALGGSIISGIVDGIVGLAGSAVGAIGGAVDGIVSGLKDLLGIASPSQLMADEIGAPMGEGAIVGMQDALAGGASMAGGALQTAGVGMAAGGGGTVINGGLNISFSGGAPATPAEAEASASMLVEALKRRGVSV